jgi:hypothetical protein
MSEGLKNMASSDVGSQTALGVSQLCRGKGSATRWRSGEGWEGFDETPYFTGLDTSLC